MDDLNRRIYIESRMQEKIKEEIMANPVLRDNKVIRDFYTLGFMEGFNTITTILSDIIEQED